MESVTTEATPPAFDELIVDLILGRIGLNHTEILIDDEA
jgi:hypothetical protein